jgi:CBS domain-containing protein
MNDVRPTIQGLRAHPPFDAMAAEHLQYLAERVVLGLYPAGQAVLAPGDEEPRHFFIIQSGRIVVEPLPGSTREEDAEWQLAEGECFPVGALVSRSPVAGIYRALEDTYCYALPADDFRVLLDLSPPFRDFCTRRLASLLDRFKGMLQAQYARRTSEQQSMDHPLSSVVRREPVSCAPTESIQSVLETMHRLGIGSMVVTDGNRKPVGIFTLHDVLSRVALARRNLSDPISTVMTSGLTTLPPHATAYDAAIAMVRQGIRHILVVDGNRLVGVVSEKDLFSLQRISMRQLSSAIQSAESLDALVQFSQDIRQLAYNMLAQGVAAEQLTQFIASLNDVLTQRIIDLEFGREDLGEIRFCWMALGSEGRLEQTFSTDQDNAIIFIVPAGSTAQQMRERLLPIARRVNEALDRCGFPLCKGNIMASNPMWCLSLEEWQSRFAAWIDSGDPEALLHGSIFFDFRALHGDAQLAQQLREWLHRRVKANPKFLHLMTANALRNRPPLGTFRDFVVGKGEHRDTLDLKLNGATPFVDAARIYSLASGVDSTNTAQRLRLVGPLLKIPREEVEAWIEAFLFIQLLRLQGQQAENLQGKPMDNRINPYELHELDRHILKEAFKQARKLQTRLALDYQV